MGTAKFREETSKKRRAEAAPQIKLYGEADSVARFILRRTIVQKDEALDR